MHDLYHLHTGVMKIYHAISIEITESPKILPSRSVVVIVNRTYVHFFLDDSIILDQVNSIQTSCCVHLIIVLQVATGMREVLSNLSVTFSHLQVRV